MTLSLDFLALPLLVAASLVFVSVLAGVLSARVGFSFLLVFLLVGILAGVDGPGGLVFEDFGLSFWVGNVALAVILLACGGLVYVGQPVYRRPAETDLAALFDAAEQAQVSWLMFDRDVGPIEGLAVYTDAGPWD